MRSFSDSIALSYNKRGIYSLDPSIGCSNGLKENKKGCYCDCYAANIANRYGYDFSKTTHRFFKSIAHILFVKAKISKIKLPFVRMGTMGDPSCSWDHTLDICELIQKETQLNIFKNDVKQIIIVTKHWNKLNNKNLNRLTKLNVCINTSVSALDKYNILISRLAEYEKIKKYCYSKLRVVSCDFNVENKQGQKLYKIQNEIFNNYPVIDTIFRVSKNNKFVTSNIINTSNVMFMGRRCIVSRYKRNTYFGHCNNCIEMCGYS